MDNVGVRTRSRIKKELDLNMDTVPVQWLTVLPGFLEECPNVFGLGPV